MLALLSGLRIKQIHGRLDRQQHGHEDPDAHAHHREPHK